MPNSNISLKEAFDIRRGEIFALLGPNGAGKTTLISIICGIVNATDGTVFVDAATSSPTIGRCDV